MSSEKQDKMLAKVRALYAKADSTTFPEEAKLFRAKADQLMEAYAIETWMLETGDDESKARLIKTREMDMSWWTQLSNVHFEAKSNVWYLFFACVRHCRCYTTWSAINYYRLPDGTREQKIKVYGLEADLSYLDLLFTDLFIQLFAKIKPQYDPNKSMGENVMRAKEAGMKYIDIAVWLGHPEWREPNGSGGYKTCDSGKMLREYKKHLSSIGKTPKDVVTVHPDSWAISYTESFYHQVAIRLQDMRDNRETPNTGSQSLALRDIDAMAKEAMYNDFPELRPHPAGCTCRACTAKRKPVKYTGGHQTVAAAYAKGGDAGKAARIINKDGGLRSTPQLPS
jgi:hypothetical protein